VTSTIPSVKLAKELPLLSWKRKETKIYIVKDNKNIGASSKQLTKRWFKILASLERHKMQSQNTLQTKAAIIKFEIAKTTDCSAKHYVKLPLERSIKLHKTFIR
jgi:hypothetical protein